MESDRTPDKRSGMRSSKFVGSTFSVFILSLVIFILLYSLRSFDNSRVAAWADIFSVVNPVHLFGCLFAALAAAAVLSRTSFIELGPSAVLGISSFAISLLFMREPEIIVDASRYFMYAKYLGMHGISDFLREWGRGFGIWTDLPAVPFLYGMIFRFLGEGRVYIQIFNSLLFAMSVIFTYRLGRELGSRDTGLYAGLFLMGIPYIYTQTPLMLVDLPAMFFVVCSVYLFLLALRRGGIMIPASAACIFITFFVKYSAWLMLTVIPVIYASELYRVRGKGIDRAAFRGMMVFFVSVVMISLLAALKHDELLRQIHLLLTYQKPGLKRWGEGLLSVYFFQIHPVISILAIVSVFAALRRKDLSFVNVSWLVIIALVLRIDRIRYLTMIFPFLCLTAAYGLSAFRNRDISKGISYSVAAFSVTLSFAGFLPFLEHTSAANIRDAGAYLDRLNIRTVRVFTPLTEGYVMNPAVSVPILDLYTDKSIAYRYDPDEYPLPGDIETSRLRFTWEFRNPEYYGDSQELQQAVAIISDRTDMPLHEEMRRQTEGLHNRRTFEIKDSAYIHQTIVTVYH